MIKISISRIIALFGTVGVVGAMVPGAAGANPTPEKSVPAASEKHPVEVEVFAPGKADNGGIAGAGWFVDLRVRYDGGLAAAGFTSPQLTGPLRMRTRRPFSGPSTNLANPFNLSGVSDLPKRRAEIWDSRMATAMARVMHEMLKPSEPHPRSQGFHSIIQPTPSNAVLLSANANMLQKSAIAG